MNRNYPQVAQRAGHRCEYCRAPEAIFNFPFEVEHVEPSSQQGSDDMSNLALACRACNLYKADQQLGIDEESGQTVPLFDPRTNVWDEHLRVDAASGSIHGTTAIGRATIARLRMNSAVQLQARLQWMRLGLFP